MTLDAVRGRGPFRRADLHAAGLGDADVRRALREGRLRQVCHGMYVLDEPGHRPPRSRNGDAEQRAERHELAVRGVLARLDAPAVVSHGSAAVLHCPDVGDLPLDRVHLTRDRPSGARRGRDLLLHAAPLPDGDVTRTRGSP